jgi:hypothetical protein
MYALPKALNIPVIYIICRKGKAQRLNAMFRTEYRGNAAKSFALAIDVYSKIYDPKKHHGRSIAVLQSSVTGKSRMVEELGNEVRVRRAVTVLVNQRASGANSQRLFPNKRSPKRRLASCG